MSRRLLIAALSFIHVLAGIAIVGLPLLILFVESLTERSQPQVVGTTYALSTATYAWILGWSTLIASISASLATGIGAMAAVGARSSPRRIARFIDIGCLIPIVFPPFVHAAAWRAGFARAGWFSPLTSIIDNFSGFTPTIWVFTTSLFPLSYFVTRLAFARINPSVIDASRVAGLKGIRLFRLVAFPYLYRALPMSFAVTFVLVLSDPLVPTFVGGDVPSAAEQVWIHATAAGSIPIAATLSLLMLIPTSIITVILIGFYLPLWRSSTPDSPTFASVSRRYSVSVPVGIRVWPRVLPGLFLVVVALTGSTIMMVGAVTQRRSSTQYTNVFANTLGLSVAALIIAAIFVGFSLWLRALLHRTRLLIDLLYLAVLVIPGATLGTGLALTYGIRAADHWLPFPLVDIHTALPGSVLITLSYLTIVTPLTYFAVRLWGPAITSRIYEAATVLGASPLRVVGSVVLPHLRHSLAVAVTIVTATSTVMVSPLMWVTSPDAAVIVPRLFTLLDHANYSRAFLLALTMGALVMVLLLATFSTLRLGHFGGRR